MSLIAVDTSPLESGHKGRGVGTYTRNLVAGLKNINGQDKFVFSPPPYSNKPDLVHYPYFDLFFPTLPLNKPARKTVVTVHDVIPLIYPKEFPVGVKGNISLWRQKLSLINVARIITDSQCSKHDIVERLGLGENRVKVVLLAAEKVFKQQTQAKIKQFKEKYDLPKFFLGYVGDVNYNKNLARLIEVVGKLPEVNLIIVTRAKLDQEINEAQTQIAYGQIKKALAKVPNNKVKVLQLDGQEELNLFYSACDFYVQPSLYEGFGLPVLEAMQSGTPVICAQAGSLPEVAGKACLYFDPVDKNDLERVILKACKMKQQREELINRGLDQAAKFSWEKAARETYNIYQEVLAE